MGFNFSGGLARGLERLIGGKAADVSQPLLDATKLGRDTFDAGNALTDSEVNTLRGYAGDYKNRLANPLGAAAGIFTRARGSLTDVATQRAGAFGARLSQQARQGGGTLSQAAIAQLTEQNQRDLAQGLFEGNVAVSNKEAEMTLSETSKLFDRMENISKTILGVGEGKAARGLQALFNALGLRINRNQAIANTIVSSFGKGGGAGSGAGNTNPIVGN